MDCVGDFARGARVDCGAVDEETFGGLEGREVRVENVVEDVFNVGGFGEDGYNRFLGVLVVVEDIYRDVVEDENGEDQRIGFDE